MEELKLRFYGDPVLREVAKRVDRFDDELRRFAEAMIAIMKREAGIGLAGPQVGVSKRILVALQMEDTDDNDAEPIVLVNPKVTSTSRDTWSYEEGCLSMPGINGLVIRSHAIEVEYMDVDGGRCQLGVSGMFARILLHEIDHLDGKLFIDYLSTASKSLIKPKLKELAERHAS